MLVKIPFSTAVLGVREKIVKHYQSEPIGVAKKLKFMMKQRQPN